MTETKAPLHEAITRAALKRNQITKRWSDYRCAYLEKFGESQRRGGWGWFPRSMVFAILSRHCSNRNLLCRAWEEKTVSLVLAPNGNKCTNSSVLIPDQLTTQTYTEFLKQCSQRKRKHRIKTTEQNKDQCLECCLNERAKGFRWTNWIWDPGFLLPVSWWTGLAVSYI